MSQRFLMNQMTDGSQRCGPLSALDNWLINIDKKVHTIRYGRQSRRMSRVAWLTKDPVTGFDGRYQPAQRLWWPWTWKTHSTQPHSYKDYKSTKGQPACSIMAALLTFGPFAFQTEVKSFIKTRLALEEKWTQHCKATCNSIDWVMNVTKSTIVCSKAFHY